MSNYIFSEHLKQKHTLTTKLIWIAPILTLLLNILAPMWYQQNSYNWWYVLLYPGFLTLLCILINQRDHGKLKYRAMYSLPVNLEKVWYAKVIICIIYAVIANVILMLCNLLGGFIIQQVFDIPMTVNMIQAISSTACIILTSIWNIPICLYLSKKIGVFSTLIVNIGLSFGLGVLGANTNFWIVCPYSWISRLMIPTLGILPNGEPVTATSLSTPVLFIFLAILLSLVLLCVISKTTANSFKKQEVL